MASSQYYNLATCNLLLATMPLDETWYTEQWAGQGSAISLKLRDKVHDEQSPYQRVEIRETETFGTLMTLDGLVMVTDRDNFVYHEMMSHPALFTHPDPKRVLIVGGGDCGTLHEVLKHPGVELAEQVELDERVTRVAEKFFPSCASPIMTRACGYTSPTASNGWRGPRPAATTSSSSIPPTRSARRPGYFPKPSIRTASGHLAPRVSSSARANRRCFTPI